MRLFRVYSESRECLEMIWSEFGQTLGFSEEV